MSETSYGKSRCLSVNWEFSKIVSRSLWGTVKISSVKDCKGSEYTNFPH